MNIETPSQQLEAEMQDVRPIRILDTHEEFQNWVGDGYGFVVYVDQVFAKHDARGDGNYVVYVRGEGNDEGTWSYC